MESPTGHSSPQPAASGEKVNATVAHWWWSIPTAIFVVVELFAGWSRSQGKESPFAFAIAYTLGGLMGGVSISALIGLVGYFVGGKSAKAGMIVYSVIFSILCFGVISGEFRRGLRSSLSKPVVTSFGDFRFEIPANWTKAKPVLEHSLALVVPRTASSARNKPPAMIQVDAASASLTARQMAESAAKDGYVLPEAVMIDGIEAIRVETRSASMARPRFMVIIVRAGKCYLVMAGEEKEGEVSSALDHILKTWRWENVP